MQPVVIVGAGGHAREVADIVEALQASGVALELRGLIADDPPDDALLWRRGLVYLGSTSELAGVDAQFVIGVGAPAARRRIDAIAVGHGLAAAILVHPAATVGSDNRLAEGVVLAAHASVTTNVTLGRHTHLNVGARVAHDCAVGDFVTVNPGATVSGNVTVGDDVTVGTNAAVIQGLRLGAGSTVGAGAAVVRDVAAGATVVGVPARPLPQT